MQACYLHEPLVRVAGGVVLCTWQNRALALHEHALDYLQAIRDPVVQLVYEICIIPNGASFSRLAWRASATSVTAKTSRISTSGWRLSTWALRIGCCTGLPWCLSFYICVDHRAARCCSSQQRTQLRYGSCPFTHCKQFGSDDRVGIEREALQNDRLAAWITS